MAGTSSKGSLRDFDYFDDFGNKWGVQLDESNTKLLNPAPSVGPATATNRRPTNLKMRKATVVDATNAIKRTAVILTPAAFSALNSITNFTLDGVDSNAGTVVAIAVKIPERTTRLIKNFDTALNDGTQP